MDTRVHCTARQRERSAQSPICQAGRPVQVLKTHALKNPIDIVAHGELNAQVRQALSLLGEGKPAQIKQLHLHTAFPKVCPLQHSQCSPRSLAHATGEMAGLLNEIERKV